MNTMYLGPDFIDDYIEEARYLKRSKSDKQVVKIKIDIAEYIFPVIERYIRQYDDILTLLDRESNTIVIGAI